MIKLIFRHSDPPPPPPEHNNRKVEDPLSFLLTVKAASSEAAVNMKTLACSMILLTTFVLAYAKDYCPKLKPAADLKISEVFGTWYAARGIEHISQTSSNSTKQTKTCPMIKIISKDNLIEFQWHSKDKPLKKLDLVQNKDNPGLLEPASKKGHSKSTLQITVKDARNIIGVTMCKPGGQVASVVLSRSPTFNQEEVQSITNILGSQGLNVNNIFDRCLKHV